MKLKVGVSLYTFSNPVISSFSPFKSHKESIEMNSPIIYGVWNLNDKRRCEVMRAFYVGPKSPNPTLNRTEESESNVFEYKMMLRKTSAPHALRSNNWSGKAEAENKTEDSCHTGKWRNLKKVKQNSLIFSPLWEEAPAPIPLHSDWRKQSQDGQNSFIHSLFSI